MNKYILCISHTIALPIMLYCSALPALAAPSAFSSKCGAILIRNNTNATLLRDSEDCNLIWVLPPTAGITQFTGFTPSATLSLCQELKTSQKISAEATEKLASSFQELEKLQSAQRVPLSKSESDDLESRIADLTKKQTAYHSDLQRLLGVYSQIAAGYAHLDYDTKWDAAVNTLTSYFGNQYQFRKIPTKDVRIFANISKSENSATYLTSLPAILDYSVNGLKFQPFGEDRAPELSSLPSHLTGLIHLSLIGGCPLYYQDFLKADTLRLAEIPQNYDFSISATFKYPAAFKLKMTATYNLFKFYEKITASAVHGGYFSSQTATTISESKLD